ncbi:MAG: hypothetical protein OXI95_15305 [bacterium]|nr:hypothetical protein [bacterium]
MSVELIAIIAAAVSLAGLILTVPGHLTARLTAVEKETARVAGLLEGLGLAQRIPE